MTANITVMVQEVKDVIKVPTTALKFSPPQAYLDAIEKNLPDSLKKKRESYAKSGGPGSGAGGGSGRSGEGGRQGGMSGGMPGGAMPGGMGGGENRRRGSFGMVWIKVGDSLKPFRVRTGISDGLNTEIVKGKIEEGQEVVTGMTSPQTTAAGQQQNPFAPQMSRGTTRGGR
jgi:multidrug efflux pump subunit AcrA (membrane-fusion protein)